MPFKASLAIGFTANYVDPGSPARLRKTLTYYRRLISKGYHITFFHPLRLVGSKLSVGDQQAASVIDDDKLVELLAKTGVFWRDVKLFGKRLKVLLDSLEGVQADYIKLVIHTEYEIPLWCNNKFRHMYVNAIAKLVEEAASITKGRVTLDNVVELHPGFTGLSLCTITGGFVKCRHAEKNVKRLGECIKSFLEELNQLGVNIIVQFEPRAGSKVIGRQGRFESQTLNTHTSVLKFTVSHFAELGTAPKIVLDPAQTILKRKSTEEAWNEVERIAKNFPSLVGEVHIHSPGARKGRGHGLPDNNELERFSRIIKELMADKSRVLSLVFEVLNTSIDKLVEACDKLLNLIEEG